MTKFIISKEELEFIITILESVSERKKWEANCYGNNVIKGLKKIQKFKEKREIIT